MRLIDGILVIQPPTHTPFYSLLSLRFNVYQTYRSIIEWKDMCILSLHHHTFPVQQIFQEEKPSQNSFQLLIYKSTIHTYIHTYIDYKREIFDFTIMEVFFHSNPFWINILIMFSVHSKLMVKWLNNPIIS